MTPETCAEVSQQFAADILQIFDYGMGLGGLLFFLGWLMGGGIQSLCNIFETVFDLYRRLKAKQ